MNSNGQHFKLGYKPALDGLRGIAVLAVLAFHSEAVSFAGGFIGVDLFFVLSGFLITVLLAQEHAEHSRIDLRAFYIRRTLRLLPAILGVLAVLWAGAFVVGGGGFAAESSRMAKVTPATLAYVSNWVIALGFDFWPQSFVHVWSLAIEEQFYLIWPVVLVACLASRQPIRTAASVAILGALAVVVWRMHLTVEGASLARRYYATDTRSDGLLVGCAMGLYVHRHGLPSRWTIRLFGTLGAVVFAVMLLTASNRADFMYVWGWVAVALSSALLILGSLDTPASVQSVLEWQPLVGLGQISYGLYLWHNLVFAFIHRVPQLDTAPAWILGTAEVAVSLAVALASYYLVERPALKLKSRFAPRTGKP